MPVTKLEYMMTPRLQKNTTCSYNLDAARNVDASSYMDRLGFFRGIAQSWENCVRRMYDDFEAARFIGNAFRAYRMIQDNFWRTLNR